MVLLKKICTKVGMRSICSNHYDRKCYSKIFPRITTTVETDDGPGFMFEPRRPDDDDVEFLDMDSSSGAGNNVIFPRELL